MSYPAEGLESTYRNHIEDVRAVLEARHQSNYMVVNVSGRSYTNNKFPGIKVVERPWNQKMSPSLEAMLEVCHLMYSYLNGRQNAVVIHCEDGKQVSAQLVAVFLVYSHVFTSPKDALSMFAVRRFPVCLSPARMRYLQYASDLIRHKNPHGRKMLISNVTMNSPPLFTKARDGCRPFVKIYSGEECVYSSCLEYEKLIHYPISAEKVEFAIPNVEAFGDVTIVISHARASTFAKSRIQAIPMAQLQLYTGYIDESTVEMKFSSEELDLIEEPDRYAENFELTISVRFSATANDPVAATFGKYFNISTQAKTPFSSKEEMIATIGMCLASIFIACAISLDPCGINNILFNQSVLFQNNSDPRTRRRFHPGPLHPLLAVLA